MVLLEEKGMISRSVVYKERTREVLRRCLKASPPTPFDTTPPEEYFIMLSKSRNALTRL